MSALYYDGSRLHLVEWVSFTCSVKQTKSIRLPTDHYRHGIVIKYLQRQKGRERKVIQYVILDGKQLPPTIEQTKIKRSARCPSARARV